MCENCSNLHEMIDQIILKSKYLHPRSSDFCLHHWHLTNYSTIAIKVIPRFNCQNKMVQEQNKLYHEHKNHLHHVLLSIYVKNIVKILKNLNCDNLVISLIFKHLNLVNLILTQHKKNH